MSVRSKYSALLLPIALAFLALPPVAQASEDDDICPKGTIPLFNEWGFVGCVEPPEPDLPDDPEPPTAPPDEPGGPPALPPKPDCPGGLPPALIDGAWYCPPPDLPEDEEPEEEEEDECAPLKAEIAAVHKGCLKDSTTRALECAIGKPLLLQVVCARKKLQEDAKCDATNARLLAAMPPNCQG